MPGFPPACTEIAMFLPANEYLLAWSAYGIAALGCLLVWLRITRPLWRWLREPLRLIMAVLRCAVGRWFTVLNK